MVLVLGLGSYISEHPFQCSLKGCSLHGHEQAIEPAKIWLLIQGCDVHRFSTSFFLDPGPLMACTASVNSASSLEAVWSGAKGWGRLVACVQQDKRHTYIAKILFQSQAWTSVERDRVYYLLWLESVSPPPRLVIRCCLLPAVGQGCFPPFPSHPSEVPLLSEDVGSFFFFF